MADEIHPDDAALIAEAVSAGRVVVCPAGMPRAELGLGLPPAQITGAEVRRARAQRAAARALADSRAPSVIRRRKAVAELLALGQGPAEIARVLGESRKIVAADIREMRR